MSGAVHTPDALERRPIDSLTRLERNWLRRGYCGWCDANGLSTMCLAMIGERCDMDAQRAKWLLSYKPRKKGGAA